MNFCSDNVTGVAPEIMEALIMANQGAAMPYGDDPLTQTLAAKLQEIFATDATMFPVATGSAANALALSVLTPSYGAVYCHPSAHINVDECGAPEFFTGGAKLVLVPGESGKIDPESLTQALESAGAGVVHHVQPAVLSLTQATEAGTVYQLEEIRTLSKIAKAHNLYVHMDGARFANALVSLGCSPAAMTWQAGVDVLSFGATKNGAMAAEAVLFFHPESHQNSHQKLGKNFPFYRKRGGHLFSKMRFLSAQLVAYLENDLWLKNASHANQMASRLAEGLQSIPGVKILFPVEANEIFVEFAPEILQTLQTAGFKFYIFDGKQMGRLVTAFNTLPEDVEKFIQVAIAASWLILMMAERSRSHH